MRAYLRVKIKSLATEATIIRTEERRCASTDAGRALRSNLRLHRVHDVRSEARAAQLAYAYIRGRTLDATEPPPRNGRNRASRPLVLRRRVEQLVRKYGDPGFAANVDAWFDGELSSADPAA